MKSPFVGMPDLMPVTPTRNLSLKLSPAEAMVLYTVLEGVYLATESNPGAPDYFVEGVESLYTRMGDKLDFVAVPSEAVQEHRIPNPFRR